MKEILLSLIVILLAVLVAIGINLEKKIDLIRDRQWETIYDGVKCSEAKGK
jgi:hypothetical protein